MRFTMPAFRTQAGAGSAPRKGAAHATSTLSASTPPLSTLTHSATFSSIHQVFLLVHTAHLPALASTAPAATGHGKSVMLQFVTEPGLNDLAQVASHKRDYLNAISGDHLMQRSGNRAANQRADTKLRQTNHLLNRQVVRQDFLRFGDDSSRLGLDDMNLPGDVEDRRDPIVPVCKSRFHHLKPCSTFTYGIEAIAAPIGDARHEVQSSPVIK
jgi:hypothetical protein